MQNNRDLEAIRACFLKNGKGKVCIALSDAAYVRAEPIIFDHMERSVYAVLHETAHFLGKVSEEMAKVFIDSQEVLLCAVHTNGGILELTAPLAITGQTKREGC